MKNSHQVFPLFVDYGRSVEDGVKAGCYTWASPDITSSNFPIKREGTDEVEMELVRFNRYISIDEVFRELNQMGYRPAELHELLVFGEKHPEAQCEFPVAAIGSSWQNRNGNYCVPYLVREYSEYFLFLDLIEPIWAEFYQFAAVRK